MKKDKKEWYGVKCIFFYPGLRKKVGNNIFEERVTVWKARSFDKAIKKRKKKQKNIQRKWDVFTQNFVMLIGCLIT